MPKAMPTASTGMPTMADLNSLAQKVEDLISFDNDGELLIASQYIDNEDITSFICKVHDLTTAIMGVSKW